MKKCFVISPIGGEGTDIRKQADEALEFVIEPPCKSRGFEVIRADRISDNGIITQSIIENILTADLAIADLSGRNANVFYELAIRHAHGLPVIQISRDDASLIPFDVQSVRTIIYDLSASGAKKASQEIEKVIESIENGSKTLNPVTSVSNILQLGKKEDAGNDSTLSELLLKVNSIPEKLQQMENNISSEFSRMLEAFGESMKMTSPVPTQSMTIQDVLMQKFFETLLNNPQKGITQMQNLLTVQKFMEDNGLTNDLVDASEENKNV